MRHRAGTPENERYRIRQRIIEQERSLIRLEISRQNLERLQIWHLAGRERNQLAHAFVECGVGADAQ